MQYFNPQPKAGKAKKDPDYITAVKSLPCCVCARHGEPFGQAPSDAHHTISGRYSGARRADMDAIPLCKAHHQTGEHGKMAIHQGKETWEAKYGPDTDYIAETRVSVAKLFVI